MPVPVLVRVPVQVPMRVLERGRDQKLMSMQRPLRGASWLSVARHAI